MDRIIKHVQIVELNTKIVNGGLNTQMLKMIYAIECKYNIYVC